MNGYSQQVAPAAAGERKKRARSNAQAHLVRAAKMPAGNTAGKDYETRNWSLFFFFRIMRQAEMDETIRRLEAAMKDPRNNVLLKKLKLDLGSPGVLSGGLVASRKWEFDEERRREKKRAGGAGAAMEGVSKSSDSAGTDTAQQLRRPPRRSAPDLPALAFQDWLKVLVNGDGGGVKRGARTLAGKLSSYQQTKGIADAFGTAPGPEAIDRAARKLAIDFHDDDPTVTPRLFRHLEQLIDCIGDHYPQTLDAIRMSIEEPPERDSPHGYLARMVLYEVLRQGAPLFVGGTVAPVLRSEADEADRLARSETLDRTPITMAFTFSGLRALKFDNNTLASFPDAFKQGMAARAARLGDVGRSAPENWEGELGLESVHGYFTGSSNLERERPLSERFWKGLREDIRSFNDPTVEEGGELRAWIGLLFRLLGLQIVHIELGQDPYEVSKKGKVRHLTERKEHFGFRDGLSQPFVDMGLGDTLPGGGTADRRGTWSPVAPGEIFLDEEDETGQKHMLPLSKALRDGSTYLVFRKLEQDVEGFRAFLEQQRPGQRLAQKKLAAQFFGRWPNGTSLVLSPHTERSTASAETEAALNDFRYAADDPHGRKCPLGAHVRRANPRDIGGRNDVRHHRILRRGIAYGGPLLAEGAPDDGEKRGILFIAANARIDLQFEVVQGDWLNGSEFLGQAGLGRCPISGAQDGSVRASFLEAGAVAPVTGLPSFVTLRGGDYFFAPGIVALKRIARGSKFRVPVKKLPYRGHAVGDVATPSLFSADRLERYWWKHFGGGSPVRLEGGRAQLPPGVEQPEKITFVGRYDQVVRVLSNDPATTDGGNAYFSVEPYLTAGRRITRGEDFLVGADSGSELHTRLLAVLNAGWNALGPKSVDRVREAAKERLDAALRRTAGARRIDLVEDLAAQAAYGVLDKVFGIRGPQWLSELVGALPFSRQHVGDLPRDWIAAFKGERPANPGLKTMQIWSTFLVADLIGNYVSQQELQAVARQAGSEMMNHIDQTIAQLRARGPIRAPANLIEAFLFNGQVLTAKAQIDHRDRTPSGQPVPDVHEAEALLAQLPAKILEELEKLWVLYGTVKDWPIAYYKDVTIILLEILASTMAVIPLTFGSVMSTLLRFRIDLPLLLARLTQPKAAAQIIYEGERLSPNSPIRFRRCMVRGNAGTDEDPHLVERGDFVAAVISRANMDRHVFWEPERFSLGTADPLADELEDSKLNGDRRDDDEQAKKAKQAKKAGARDADKYLLFGVEGSKKICWGRHLVAMPVLEECLYACGRLQGLRKVAGPQGEPQKIGNVTIGLPARFTRILAKDARQK